MVQRGSAVALLALAIPVLTGIVWQLVAGAPAHYPLVGTVALVLAFALVLWAPTPPNLKMLRIAAAGMCLLMLVPLATGPALHAVGDYPVSRWLPLGPINFASGLFAVPVLVALCAQDREGTPFILGIATICAMLQPDAASGFALTFAAVALHHVTRDWRTGVVAILAFFASIWMALRGELAPAPFVERVLFDAVLTSWPVALALALAWAVCFAILLFALPARRASRFAVSGALFGMIVTSLMSYYPSVLIGYGAAPILGFGLALGIALRADIEQPAQS